MISVCQNEVIKMISFMPQIISMKLIVLYILLLTTLLMFSITNYFTQSPDRQCLKIYRVTKSHLTLDI
jgi:hypothetical protein